MYPGTAIKREFVPKKATVLPFKQKEDGNPDGSPALLAPAVNITETGTEYRIVIASPGMQREDFSIEMEQCVISISAKKEKVTVSCVNDRYEYDYNDWTRAFSLPDDADAMLAHAKYKNGELIIRIPRGNTSENQAKATIYVY